MSKHYQDYVWKNGIPYGITPVENPANLEVPTYKIVMDPYRKRISIEKYEKNLFQKVVYDSMLLNFRHLQKEEHHAWQKTTVYSEENRVICHLRDQDDRFLFQETYYFEGNLCKECLVESSHGLKVSVQRLYYKHLGGAFNGVILFDANDHPVVKKEYEFDEELNEFTELIEANWDMTKMNFALV